MARRNFITALLGIAYIFFFAVSFPLVIPGTDEPIPFHRLFGSYTVYFVFPFLLGFLSRFETFRARYFWGWFVCSIASLLVFYWAFFAIHTYGGVGPFFTLLLLIGMMGGESFLFWSPFIVLWHWLERRGKAIPILIAAIWTCIEASRNFFPVDFFWSAIGHSQYNNLFFIQWAAVGSNYILSFFIVWVSTLAYGWIVLKERRIREAALCLIFFLIMGSYSLWRLEAVRNTAPVRYIKTALFQPNIGQEIVNAKSDQVTVIVDRFTAMLKRVPKDTDLVVWHEAAMPVRIPLGFTDFNKLWDKFFPDAPQFPKQIMGLDIVDISDQENFKYYNSAGFIDNGKIAKVYNKIKLAPFGEYLPWSDLMASIGLTTLVPSTVGAFQRGTEYTVYDFGFAKACILICYDGTFSENVRGFVLNGADLIVSITNDAWFGYSSAASQHTSFYNFRAVETGRTIIRAANTGISGVLLPDGTMPVRTPIFTEALLIETVPIYQIDTPYLRWGNFFIWTLVAGSIAWLCYLFLTDGRREKNPQKK